MRVEGGQSGGGEAEPGARTFADVALAHRDILSARLDELGVEVRCETGATALVTEGDAVAGLCWKHFGQTGAIRASAVVLAAGGFVMNEAMVAEHAPHLSEKPFVLGSSYDDGLGIRLGGLATSVDAEVLDTGGASIPGLHAAGAGAATLAQDVKGYASGTQLGEGSFFGRRAGRHAAGPARARRRDDPVSTA